MTEVTTVESANATSIIQLFHTFLTKVKPISRGAVDDQMHCCPKLKTEDIKAWGHLQHRGGESLTVSQKDMKYIRGVFVFAYAKSRFSHYTAKIILSTLGTK